MLSPIEEIKSRLDIVEVVGSYIKLTKCGSNYRTLCPFHSEKTPSFFVSPRLQIFKCFGCNVAGDIFKFVMLIEGVEFGDALRILAKRAGVELKPILPEIQTERKRLYEICELAARFFEKQLEGKKGQEVVDYLKKRKISEKSIKKWRLGWAPDTWDSLVKFLVSKNYKKEEIEKAGLGIRNKDERIYDRFRGRIIFPIFDLNSQVIGFAGRYFQKEEGPKYINSPTTLLYNKSKVLYGLDKAKVEIRKKDFVLLVEGYVDVILAHQEGYENTVSVSGTSLTSLQLDILRRYTQNLYLCFDMDVGGDLATKRGIDLAKAKGFKIKILTLPKDKDPADILAEDGKEFDKILEGGVSIMEYYFQNAFSKFDPNTLEGKQKIIGFLLPEIKTIPDEIEKSFWIEKLSQTLKVREEDLRKELTRIKLEQPKTEEKEVEIEPKKTKKEILEEKLLSLILKSPKFSFSLSENSYYSQEFLEVLTFFQKNRNLKPEQLSEKARELFTNALLRSEVEEIDKEKILNEISFCQKEIQKIGIKTEMADLRRKLEEAEKEKRFDEVEEISKRFSDLSQKLLEI